MSNLLSKNPLTQAQETAEVYVVWNQQDFRMSLATLVSLVTKAKIGLGNVDNTSDANKPVSVAVAAALEGKVNTGTVPTLEEFNALAASLQGLVTLEQLNTAINQVVDAMNGYVTGVEVDTAIAVAVQPITQTLQTLSDSIQSNIDRITALEQGGMVGIDQTQLSTAITFAIQTADQNAADRDTVLLTDITTQLTAINQALGLLSIDFENHTHIPEHIVGLQAFVDDLITVIATGDNQW